MGNRGRFYITTAIYYTNGRPHLGHVFEVIGIDVQARYRRLIGHDVRFLTGTDEHGQKIQNQATARGVTPLELCDSLAEQFKAEWAKLEVSNDDFIRTTEPRQHAGVTKMWRELESRGHIYRGVYEGWYNSRDEAYLSEKDLEEQGLSKDDPFIKWTSEPCAFFRLSSFQEAIERLLAERPDFIQPAFHAKEMMGSFIRPEGKPGLKDLCISRSTISWGIPVPGQPGEVVYVWLDALTNYLSAIGYGSNEEWKDWWPADVHVVGKDILKFHTIIWPAMLMAAGIELPRQIYAHGFITLRDAGTQEEVKMAKSVGNIIDPNDLIRDYGVSALRYHLMREFNYGGDGAFIEANLRARYDADLANGLGNLSSRALNIIEKSLGGSIRPSPAEGEDEATALAAVEEAFRAYDELMPRFEYQRALTAVWDAVRALNVYMDRKKPWNLAKDPARGDELARCMYFAAEGVRCAASMIQPFMPTMADELWRRLKIERPILEIPWEEHRRWGLYPGADGVAKGDPLFPRLGK